MADAAFDALLPVLQQGVGSTLWVADENALLAVKAMSPRTELCLLSNRWDVVQAAAHSGHAAVFSDFDFSAYVAGSFSRIVFRIAKEKPVNHHVLNHAFMLLASGGELLIAGLKSEGAKTFIEKTGKFFGNFQSSKCGLGYVGKFYKVDNSAAVNFFDDQQYPVLRWVETPPLHFYSKPGLFGWEKVDQGSAFLIEHLPVLLAQYKRPPQSLLDLGCGYGYLALMTRTLPLERRVATDNNAAALLAMQRNVEHYGMSVDVLADDAGGSLRQSFDLILCNPPFHQGFDVDSTLTEKFLCNARRVLARHGKALFVVNAFIGIERIAVKYFKRVETLANGGAFKLVILQND